MSANKRKNLNAMEEDPSDSDSETSSDDEDDGPHPDAYTGNEVCNFNVYKSRYCDFN